MPSFDALVLDLIGTFFDEYGTFDAALTALLGPEQGRKLHTTWIAEENALYRELVEERAPYQDNDTLVKLALETALKKTGIEISRHDVDELSQIYANMKAYPDSAAGPDELRKHFLVVGLTNGSLKSLSASAQKQHMSFHVLLSTSQAKTQKPNPRAYLLPQQLIGLDLSRCLFIAAHPDDLRGAQKAGYRTAFVKRPNEPDDVADKEFDYTADGLDDLVRQLTAK